MTTHPTAVVPPLDVAKQLDAWGFNVLPAATRTKSPIIKWKPFQRQRTTGKLSAWFGGARAYNYWTTTGSIIERICLDCDNEYTERYWREVIGPEIFDATTRVKTRKGHHYWFTIPSGLIVASTSVHPEKGDASPDALSYDLRAESNGIILPPSVHESGFVYGWEVLPREMLPAPEVLTALKGSGTHGQPTLGGGGTASGEGGEVRSLLTSLLQNPPSGDGSGRNIWLTKVCGHYAKQFRTLRDAYELHVQQAADRLSPPLDDVEVTKTLESIWTAEQVKAKQASDSGYVDGYVNGFVSGGQHDPNDIGCAIDGYRLTDTGNSERLIALSNGELRYVNAWGKWIVYLGGRWAIDSSGALVTEFAKRVARSLFELVADTDSTQRAGLYKFATRSESSGAINAMISLARGNPSVLTDHEDLDAHPELLNVLNATIDLRTGELRPHNPADLLALQVNVEYHRDAACPLWDACLERWQPEPVIRAYLQLEAGAGACGLPTETLSIHWGSGGNGRSKFWGAVQHVLGDYATVPHKSLLMANRHDQHETVKADLFRRRLGVFSESKAADTLDDENVKSMTGSDRMRARRMREDTWTFDPTHTLILFTNHKPQIRGSDEAIWRRVRLVPWEVTIPEAERDIALADKLRAESPGILNWIIDGARTFLTQGFDPPDAVRAATASYRTAEDVVGRFIAEVLHFDTALVVSSAALARELEDWCRALGIDAAHMSDLASALKERGCSSSRRMIKGQRDTYWAGVDIAVDGDPVRLQAPTP